MRPEIHICFINGVKLFLLLYIIMYVRRVMIYVIDDLKQSYSKTHAHDENSPTNYVTAPEEHVRSFMYETLTLVHIQ